MQLMMRVVLWSLAVVIGLIVVLTALVMWVDPNVYRAQLAQGASVAFGRQVHFEGPIALEPSLRPRVVIENLKISNPGWASRPYLAKVEQVEVRVELLPLLWGEVNAVSVAFKGIDLLLEKGPKGTDNFTFGKPGRASVLPDIEQFSLERALIAQRTPGKQTRRLHLDKVHVANAPGEPTVIKADARGMGSEVAVSMRVAPGAGGEGGLDLAALLQRARLDFKVTASEGGLRYSDYLVGRTATIEISEIEGRARPGGRLAVTGKATLNQAPITLSVEVDPLSELAQHPEGPWNIGLEVLGSVTRFTAQGRVGQPLKFRGFDVDYELAGTDIDALLPLFDLLLPFEGPYEIKGHILDHPDATEFSDIAAKTAKTTITGSLVVHYEQERPRIVAHLSSERLYIPDLIPLTSGTNGAQKRERLIPDYKLPVEELKDLDSEWHVQAEHVYTDAGELGDMSFEVTARNGHLVMKPLTVTGASGSRIVGGGEIDASRNPPFTRLYYNAERLNYGLLLAQAEVTKLVKGHIDITFDMSGVGYTRHQFLSSAKGRVVIVGDPGEFASRKLDLWGGPLITTMLSPEWEKKDVTRLNCVVARIEVKDGIARTDSILIDTDRITIAGSGTLNLDSEALDLTLSPRPKRATLVSLASAAHVTGTLASPQVERTDLPPERVVIGGVLAGLINPAFLILTFSHIGGEKNPCAAAVEEAVARAAEEQ